MSSSNRVRVAFIPEVVYGETPIAGVFETARFTSESLSGTPETTESEQIRTDRMSSGQVTTALTVGGDLNFELAKEAQLESFFESAFYNTWALSGAAKVATLDLDVVAKTLDRAAGDFAADGVEVGDIMTLGGFANTENNTEVQVTEVVSATQLRVVGPDDMVDEVGDGETFKVADKLSIGVTKKAFSMEKKFEDLVDKGINYRGQIVESISLNVAHGEIVTGTLSFKGNDYQPVSAAGDFMTNARTVNPPANTRSMNGSVDMPFLISGATGTLDESTFCIQSIETTMNNNLTSQNCIGRIAPQDYSEGTASIEQSITAILGNDSWALMAKKLTQEPFAIGYQIKNTDGFYGFFIPAIQVSFEDPASAGQNQDVLINMTGTAKVGANGESALTMYRG